MGIEPTSSAWKAEVLPLNYTRQTTSQAQSTHHQPTIKLLSARTDGQKLVEGGGFEPPKALPADLQSAHFDRSGTPPA